MGHVLPVAEEALPEALLGLRGRHRLLEGLLADLKELGRKLLHRRPVGLPRLKAHALLLLARLQGLPVALGEEASLSLLRRQTLLARQIRGRNRAPVAAERAAHGLRAHELALLLLLLLVQTLHRRCNNRLQVGVHVLPDVELPRVHRLRAGQSRHRSRARVGRARRLRCVDILPRLPVVGEGGLGRAGQGRGRGLLVWLVALPRVGDLGGAGLLGGRQRRDELAPVGLERLLRGRLRAGVDRIVARPDFGRDCRLLLLVGRAAGAALAATERKMPPRNRRGFVAAHEVLEGGPVVPDLAFREHQCSALLVTPVSAPRSQ